MAIRKPLVQINGQLQELPSGDSLAGASSGTTVALVANFSMTDGELSISHLSSMTPTLVDGEFIVTLETI